MRRVKRVAKRRVKRARREISEGFLFRDPVAGHVLGCGDSTDFDWVARAIRFGFSELADLVLSDPPYALSKEEKIRFENRADMGLNEKWDVFEDDAAFAEFLSRIVDVATSISRGNVWTWTSDWWISDLKRWLRARGQRVWPTYHWCKTNPAPVIRKANHASAVEYLGMAAKKGNFFDLKAFPKQRNYFVASADWEFAPAVSPHWVERPVVSQAERLKRADGKDVNPTQKPLDLVEALVRGGAPENGVVVDLCGGTGTTLVAADRSGRRCVYLDRDPEMLRAAANRLLRDRRER